MSAMYSLTSKNEYRKDYVNRLKIMILPETQSSLFPQIPLSPEVDLDVRSQPC